MGYPRGFFGALYGRWPRIVLSLTCWLLCFGCARAPTPNRSMRSLKLVMPATSAAVADAEVSARCIDRVAEAQAQLEARRRVLIRGFVADLAEHGLGDFRRRPRSISFRRMAAGLHALARAAQDSASQPDRLLAAEVPEDLPAQIEAFTRTLYAYRPGTVGGLFKQRGDFDFLMKEMVSLLYVYRDRPELLTDEAAFNIIDRALGGFAGVKARDRLSFQVSVPLLGALLEYPETENHVLMTLSSIYLTNQWIVDNPRRDPRLRRGRYRDLRRFDNRSSELEDTLLQAIGRVLHNGFWEINGRPYQAMTAHALMNLNAFASSERMRTAARNALDLLATKFAFQSFEMKRIGPYRRSAHNVATPGIYGNDGVIFMFGALAGGYAWPDDFFAVGNAAGHALWATLLAYRIPWAVHDFMLDKHDGYWARMQSRFADADYARGKPASYFRKDGRLLARGRPEFLQELYFVTPRFLNAAGGRFNRYPVFGDVLTGNDGVRDLDFLSRPFAIIPRGHLSQWHDLSDMAREVLVMPGEARFWRSDNSGTYKSFSYGYFHDDKDDRHLEMPMRIPARLSRHLYREGSRQLFSTHPDNRARFSFLDLSDVARFGFYVVLGSVSKSAPGRAYRAYARGFWEVVPAKRFRSVRALKQYVLEHNPKGAFRDDLEGPHRFYRYTMTTGEILELDPLVGVQRPRCENPIRRVWAAGADPDRDPPLPLAEVLFDRCDASTVAKMPLLDVREVDPQFQLTGVRLAYAAGDGRLWVENPYLHASLSLDSSDYRDPKRQESVAPAN